MRIGVVSDSHGEIENLRRAALWLIDKQNVEVIVHLGDNYDDAYILENLDVQIIKVPGVFSDYYKDKDIPNRIIETFDDTKVLVTHTERCHENDLPEDLMPEELVSNNVVDVILCGHSHIPRIEKKHNVLYINPGHLKTENKKGFPPSVAVVDFMKKIIVSIYNLKGELLQREIFNHLKET